MVKVQALARCRILLKHLAEAEMPSRQANRRNPHHTRICGESDGKLFGPFWRESGNLTVNFRCDRADSLRSRSICEVERNSVPIDRY